jgi:hypothetical protein
VFEVDEDVAPFALCGETLKLVRMPTVGESPDGRELTLRSGKQLGRRAAGWRPTGGEQEEPSTEKILNSIRFQTSASLLVKGEVRELQAVLTTVRAGPSARARRSTLYVGDCLPEPPSLPLREVLRVGVGARQCVHTRQDGKGALRVWCPIL